MMVQIIYNHSCVITRGSETNCIRELDLEDDGPDYLQPQLCDRNH